MISLWIPLRILRITFLLMFKTVDELDGSDIKFSFNSYVCDQHIKCVGILPRLLK